MRSPTHAQAQGWLPPGKIAAVCFSIDDVHPGTSQDAYEAGGDLSGGALGRLMWLQRRHAQLKSTLCVTPDWRLNSLVPMRFVRHIPLLRRRMHWGSLHPPGHFRLDRHPRFVAFLNNLERCETVLHGLHHSHPGKHMAVEFQNQPAEKCAAAVHRGLSIFTAAGVRFVRGYVPPAWNATAGLIQALKRLRFDFLCSARDLRTDVTPQAVTSMNGLTGLSLIYPQYLEDSDIVHLTCNFQATSAIDRAFEILELGGVLHIKAHIFKSGGGHTMLDGLDELYCNYLDLLFGELARRFGDALWWAHLSEVAARVRCAS